MICAKYMIYELSESSSYIMLKTVLNNKTMVIMAETIYNLLQSEYIHIMC